MEIRIYDTKLFFNDEYDQCELVATTDKTIDFGGFITFGGKSYRMCSFNPKSNVLGVEEVELNHSPEPIEYESDFTCPYCGVVDDDAWELQSDNGFTECGACGSTLQYERHVQVEYSVQPIKAAPITQL